ncbi:hypothetical protein [Neisseria iguanae]|uniref:hypothetical protein n=1 Tax=Neisseria iguanae TaxID=90242 RepID=UPI000D1055B6|nr:hypothetical protein [Neisseria iguanae]
MLFIAIGIKNLLRFNELFTLFNYKQKQIKQQSLSNLIMNYAQPLLPISLQHSPQPTAKNIRANPMALL